MAFKPSGSLNPHGGPVLRRIILGNSITVVVNDALEPSSGFAVLGTSANPLLGNAVALNKRDGSGLTDNGSSAQYVGSFLTTSDNQTVARVGAQIDISKETLYSAEVSATIGTTTGSNLVAYRMDLSDEDTLDESRGVIGTSSAKYANWGTDPADSTKAFVNLFESHFFGPLS